MMRSLVVGLLCAVSLVVGVWVGQELERRREVVCDHPEWTDAGYATLRADCGGTTVVILD